MTADDKKALNRRIARALGFKNVPDSEGVVVWHAPECPCLAIAAIDKCNCIDACYWGGGDEQPDFLADENASALLLERIPLVSLERQNDGSWACRYVVNNKGEWEWSSFKPHEDRKTAIALAFDEWFKSRTLGG